MGYLYCKRILDYGSDDGTQEKNIWIIRKLDLARATVVPVINSFT